MNEAGEFNVRRLPGIASGRCHARLQRVDGWHSGWTRRTLALVALALHLTSWADTPVRLTVGQRMAIEFPGDWVPGGHPLVDQTLRSTKVLGCKRYVYRKAARSELQFLVYCTQDGKRWRIWLLFTGWPSAVEMEPMPEIPPPG